MNLALRPYATAGVAVVGATFIAVTPAATPPAPIEERTLALAASDSTLVDGVGQVLNTVGGADGSDPAFLNPITEWMNVLTAADANLQTLGGIVAADPFPILSQYVTNQIGYAHTLAEGLHAAGAVLDAARQGLPATLETASHDIASGNIVGGVEDIWNHAGSFGTGGLFVAIGDVFQAIRSVAEATAGNLDSFVTTAFDGNPFDIAVEQYANTPTSPLGDQFGNIAFPVHDAVVSSTYLAQDIVNAVGSGNYVTALSDIINASAIITGAVLNGTTENFGPDDQLNFAFPDSGLLTSSPIPSPLPFGGDDDPFPAKNTGGSIFDVLWARLALANAIDPTAAGHTDPLNTTAASAGGLAEPSTTATHLSAMLNPVVTMAPHAVAAPDVASPLQSVIDQLTDAQQHITDTNSNFPFIVPSDLSTLHDYEQMLSLTMLGSEFGMVSRQLGDVIVPWVPYSWDANAADPQPFLVYNNPDDFYSVVPVDPGKTYVVTVDPGPGTQDVTFLPNAGNGVTTAYQPLVPLDLANATPNPDGDYTITLSPTPAPDNWVDTAGAQVVIIRDTLGDWGQIHDSFAIQEEGVPQKLTVPLLSDDQISSRLSTVAANLPTENLSGSYFGQVHGVDTVPINTFSTIAPTTEHIPGPLLSDQLTSLGHFSLQPDQALIVKVPDIDAAYSSIMLANDWGETDPFATVSGSLNDTQAFHDPDGFTYYVISSQDPGVANWVDDSGINDGGVWLRWQDVTGPVPSTPVQDEVVDVADVRNDLPADTPVVTPAEYAADFKERLFDYDYAHDQDHSISWAGANLMYDQVKASIGTEQFNEIFGSQQDVPSILDRLTPALSPDPVTIAHDIVTNPAGSLSAIVDNLPLAAKDIELPGILAVMRLYVLVEQTAQAVHGISSDDLSQVLAALGTGVRGFGAVLDETLTDPATSISAGILNARDDLAVAVMNAPSGFEPLSESAPLWDSLLDVNQELLAALAHLAG